MSVEIEDSYEPISESKLTGFESELGIKLPSDYRNFLLKHNGGRPHPNVFDVLVEGSILRTGVNRFLGFSDSESETFSNYFEVYADRIPKNLFPIATGLSVDLICLSIRGEDYGKVYYWDHNWEVTDGEPDYRNIHLIADNFADFLNKLYPY